MIKSCDRFITNYKQFNIYEYYIISKDICKNKNMQFFISYFYFIINI